MLKKNQRTDDDLQQGERTFAVGVEESVEDRTEGRRKEDKFRFRNRLEYLATLFILQSGNYNFLVTTTKSVQFKGISFLILYYSIHHIVIAPLQCQHLFLGFYSKFGFMKVWNIFPIGYGVGASMMAFSLYTCIRWSAFNGELILQFALVPFVPDNYWSDCEYESKHLPPCYELKSEHGNIDCNTTYYPGIAQYYRVSNLWRPDEKPNGIGPLNTKWTAASALVWMIVCLLTISDFKSFKGVFTKLICFVTIMSLVITVLQWSGQGPSEKGTLFMLDFTGLYSYRVWIKALSHAILMSYIYQGTIIELGSYGPENVMPDTDALLVGFLASTLQFLRIYCIYAFYGSMADIYSLDINCFISPHEAIMTALIPTQLSLFPMAKLWILAVFLILLIKGIMEITIVFTTAVNSFLEILPSAKAYRPYLVSVVALSCFSISLIFTTKAGAIFAHNFPDFVGTLVSFLILAIVSSLILFSYSVTRLCDDIQFMHKFEPTLLMKAVFYLTPLLATYYTINHLAIFLSLPTHVSTLYNEFWELKYFLILCCITLITPSLLVSLIMYGLSVRTNTVGLLFEPTKYWGCPDEEVNKARRRFNPRRELRYMVNKPCVHICLLKDERMQIEIEKREAIRNILKERGLEAMKELG